MGDKAQKAMSVLNKIAYRRRTLKTKSIVARHGWKVVVGCYLLGVITAASFSFVYYKSSELFNLNSYRSLALKVNVAETVHAQVADARSDATVKGTGEGSVSPSTAAVADMIWSRESSRGKNNYSKCEAQGMVNGIGYGIPGNGKYMCFESHEEEMQVLEDWLARHQEEGMSYVETICHYSGNNYPECK